MANIKSQKKRNLQNEKAHERNKAVRSALKTETKKTLSVASSGDVDAVEAQLRTTTRAIDKARAKGMLHKKTAARRKSRLAKQVARTAASS